MLALILHVEATPMHIGSRLVWWMLAGNDHAAARHFGADQFRREVLALRRRTRISSVMMPWRA